MSKIFLSLLITLMTIYSMSLSAIEFDEQTPDDKFKDYKESCDSGQMANCYQIAQWYKKYQRLDRMEVAKHRTIIENLKEKRKTLKLEDDKAELEPEELEQYKIASATIGEEAQKGAANQYYKEYLDKACTGGEAVACAEAKGTNVYEGSFILYYSSLGLIFLAAFLIAKTYFQDTAQFEAAEKLEDQKQANDLDKHGFILKTSRVFFKRYLSPIVSGMKNRKTFKDKYRRSLAAAGLTSVLTPEDFVAFKLFLIVGFPIVFIITRFITGADWPLPLVVVLGVVGYFYPDLWISGKIEQRQKEIILNMPFCVDMLALSVEAGLDFIAAMSKVNEKAKASALTEEFEIVIREIKIGASRAEALRNLAWRVDLIQISSFCATLVAADSVGASIGPILKALAVEIRQKKSAEIEKAGATAATKILFPMMIFIIPSVLLIVFAPIVLEMVRGK
jgi:tight adherence protein C